MSSEDSTNVKVHSARTKITPGGVTRTGGTEWWHGVVARSGGTEWWHGVVAANGDGFLSWRQRRVLPHIWAFRDWSLLTRRGLPESMRGGGGGGLRGGLAGDK